MNTTSSEPGLGEETESLSAVPVSNDWDGLRQAGLLRSAGRDPLVLAFVSRLCVDGDEPDIERIRVEVRGLGVTMMLISDDAVWCLADDSLRKVRAPAEVDPAALRDLAERFGMLPGAETASAESSDDRAAAPGLRAVFVIDPAFALRFAHVVAAGEQVLLGRQATGGLGAPLVRPRAADGSPLAGPSRSWSSQGTAGRIPADLGRQASRPALVPLAGVHIAS